MFNNLHQNEQGYDARVHYVLKKLVITVLRHKTKERVYCDFYYNEGGGKGGGNSEPNSNHSINIYGATNFDRGKEDDGISSLMKNLKHLVY